MFTLLNCRGGILAARLGVLDLHGLERKHLQQRASSLPGQTGSIIRMTTLASRRRFRGLSQLAPQECVGEGLHEGNLFVV